MLLNFKLLAAGPKVGVCAGIILVGMLINRQFCVGEEETNEQAEENDLDMPNRHLALSHCKELR